MRTVEIHVAPGGRDTWSGRFAAENATRTDGPVASLLEARQRARRAVREQAGASVRVLLHAGLYRLDAPVEFDGRDSGPVSYEAAGDGPVVLDGGVEVRGWVETTINGCAAWVTDAAPLLAAGCSLRSLFVDGQRRPRPAWPVPENEWLWIESVPGHDLDAALYDGAHAFIARPGDIDPSWANLTDIEVICSHFWVSERMPIASYDPDTRRVVSSRQSIFCLRDSYSPRWAKYRLENVFAALRQPGQWYHDRKEGRLIYLPRDGESPEHTRVLAPRAFQLLRVAGEPGAVVQGLHFRGLKFCHTEWLQSDGHGRWWEPGRPAATWKPRDSYAHNLGGPPPEGRPYATTPQAAFELPGVLHFTHAADCVVEDCTIEHTGFHGIVAAEGCTRLRFSGNTLRDLGAGGILADGGAAGSAQERHTSHLAITDNTIEGNGHVFPGACGIATLHGYRHVIAHNRLSDLTYSGISCGWVWGYEESISREIRIEHNHIHGLGRRAGLSDLGGIYLLGVQPGTVVRGNVVHDLAMANYGAWGIYLDQGASFVTVEGNVVLRTQSEAYHEHWGRQNLVRGNLFALSRTPGVVRICPEPWGDEVAYPAPGGLFTGNVLVSEGQPIYVDHENYLAAPQVTFAANILWDQARTTELVAWDHAPWPHHTARDPFGGPRTFTLADLQGRGLERHSTIQDPGIDFQSTPPVYRSPETLARDLGFRLPDVSQAGPRQAGSVCTGKDPR